MRIYQAGPIFFQADKFRNDYFYKKLTEAFPDAYIYDPLQNTDINGVEGKKKFGGSQEIANGDNIRLDNTDVLIACIDGDDEKIMRGDNKFLIGICTDTRQCFLTHSEAKDVGGAASLGEQQYSYQNLYVTGLIKQAGVLVSSIEEAIEELKKVYSKYDNA